MILVRCRDAPIEPTNSATAIPRELTATPSAVAPDAVLRVLFIGNSFTMFNDLPKLFSELAQSGGHAAETEMSAQGGWTLAQHAERAPSVIDGRDWDVVVLQEQSTTAASTGLRKEKMYPAARVLDERIRANGGCTVFFSTWGFPDGLVDEELELGSYEAMQAALSEGYRGIAAELGADVAPVGAAWQETLSQVPETPLWRSDRIHASLEGSYLTASVFYALLFQESPVGLPYTAGLPEEKARFLAEIAAKTVLGDASSE
jgi:hypothetical protein